MSEIISCGFGRVFLYKTKQLALKKVKFYPGESKTKYKLRILDERYNLIKEKYKNYERMHFDRGKFMVSQPRFI